MKICPVCQESNHDVADVCMLCGASLPELPIQRHDADQGDQLMVPAREPEPPRGALALAIYHDREARVIAYYALDADVSLIGREDAARGVFPDIDVSALQAQGVSAPHVSRQHARLLRLHGRLWLEVLPGSTGTQLNRTLVQPGATVPVAAGDRVIFGGRVRTKLVQC